MPHLRSSQGVTLSAIASLLLLVVPITASAQVVVRGRVTEAGTGRPVPFAFVELLRGSSRPVGTVADSMGYFLLRASSSGSAHLMVSRIGFEAITTRSFDLMPGDTIRTEVQLGGRAVKVEPVIVSSALETGVLAYRLEGHYRRKQMGIGHFIGKERLEASGGGPLSELLRSVPGISVFTNRNTAWGPVIMTNTNQVQTMINPARRGARVPNSQLPSGPCPMQLFIDGQHFRTQDGGVDVIPTHELIAVEVFRGLAEVPAEFSGLHSRCGVISVWTRRQ